MKEVNSIRYSVLNGHPLGIALDQLGRCSVELVSDQKGRFLMPQLVYDDLTKRSLIVGQLYTTVQNTWGLIDPRNALKLNSSPSGNRLLIDLLEHLGRTSPECNKGNSHLIELIQMTIGRQLGVKDQFLRKFPRAFPPELDESKDLLILLVLSQLSIGIAENPLLGILGQESKNSFLPATPLRNIMFFHQGLFAVEGNGMEVQIKGPPPAKSEPPHGT